ATMICAYWLWRSSSTAKTSSNERKQIARRKHGNRCPTVGEETVTDDFRLLFNAVAIEWLPRSQAIIITAKWVAHQRQIETAAFLRLPHMRHFVDEIALGGERFAREIVRPAAAVRMEPNGPHRRHR